MRTPLSQRISLIMVLLAITGCGIATDKEPRTLPVTSAGPVQTANPVPPGAEPTTVYLVRDGLLVPVVRRAATQLTPTAVLDALLAGPDRAERARGLTTAAPIGARVARTDYARQLVVIALSDTDTARTDEVLGYAQLVTTLTQLKQINHVLFERDGQPIAVPRADGSLSNKPLIRLDYARLL